ncbi:domain found in IF2B/IF5-domain-containing protein [Lipomyces oligophaga]|uniref:domain found in IF2B/IF5-domain-containing protein n=1 Tax=Lipomyces oligophaga TaxID=45792 RepID=UPI0034CD1DC5
MSINIQRDNRDPFYRYKMPPIISKIEGRGNGIKTAIVNNADVARALCRPPMYVTKFFGLELGAQTSVNETTDRYMVNGSHGAERLQELLDVFITKFVLCDACRNPETDIVITKDQMLYKDCKACGKRSPIDIRHKLAGVILKNPPSQGGKKGTASAGRKSRKASAGADEDDADNANANDSDDELTRRIASEAEALPPSSAEINGAYGSGDGDDDDDDWAVDTSDEAVRAREKELQAQMGSLSLGDDEEDDGNNAYSQLGNWVLEQSAKPDNVEVFKKIKELGIENKHRTLQVLAQSLFDENILSQIKSRAPLLKKLMAGDNHEKAFLGGTERLIGLNYPQLIPSVPKILHQYYDNDIVSEEAILKWGSRASKKYVSKDISKKVRRAAQPFLTWLEEASEEEEDDDEEEEDDDEEEEDE